MMQIGGYNYLKVKEQLVDGLILSDGNQDVMLSEPKVSLEVNLDDELFVFVYQNQEGDLVATTKRPFACAGDFAFLNVIDKQGDAVFMDIGIDTPLFIPGNNQEHPLEAGNSYVVYVLQDKHTGKLTASSWLEDYTGTDFTDLEEGDEVSLLICAENELGYNAIINNRYMGSLYRNEVYEDLEPGNSRQAYIRKIRQENNKIDLSLRQPGFDFILDSKDILLDILRDHNGVLDLGDKSAPEEIHQQLKMSKKAFKQVIGGLYKERLITISDHQIRLVQS